MSVLSSLGASIAQVIVGSVTPDDSSAVHVPQTDAFFTDFEVNSRYEECPNVYMAGNTSSAPYRGSTVSFFQLASKTVLWIVDWTALRLGKQPLVPSKNPADSNWVFLYATPETEKVVTAPDGVTPLYRISGTYVYGHKNPPEDIYTLVTYPRPPWLPDTFDRTQPSSMQTQGLMNYVRSKQKS